MELIILENAVMANIDMNKNLICDDDLELVTGGTSAEDINKLADKIKKHPGKLGPKNNPGKNDDYFTLKDRRGNNEGSGQGMSS